MRYKGLIHKYKDFLPVTDKTPELSLQEGNTPLIPLEHLSKEWGIELFVKYEGANPTGSFKDRGMVMAVAKAKEEGSKAIICASTGIQVQQLLRMGRERDFAVLWLSRPEKLPLASWRRQKCTVLKYSRSKGISMKRSKWCAN